MKAKVFSIVAAPSLLALTGCAPHPFVRTDGPVTSSGVAVALVDQSCSREPWDKNSDVLTLAMRMQITNTSHETVAVQPAQLRLLARGNTTAPDSVGGAERIAPGATAPVRVTFRRVGNAKCNQRMQLSLEHAVEIDGREISLRPLGFVPEHSDT